MIGECLYVTIQMLSINKMVTVITMTKKIIHPKTQRQFTSAMQILYLQVLLLSPLSISTDMHKNSISELWERVAILFRFPERKKKYFMTVKNIL